MARRRMFSQTVIASDSFLFLSVEAQCLYFHLNLYADDEGFVQNPKMTMKILGCLQTHLEELAQTSYILCFDSGVIVITHWYLHNTIRKDRFQPTVCIKEKELVTLTSQQYILSAQIHSENAPNWLPSGCQSDNQQGAQYSIVKFSIVHYHSRTALPSLHPQSR